MPKKRPTPDAVAAYKRKREIAPPQKNLARKYRNYLQINMLRTKTVPDLLAKIQ
jgi:hypothetical protein